MHKEIGVMRRVSSTGNPCWTGTT